MSDKDVENNSENAVGVNNAKKRFSIKGLFPDIERFELWVGGTSFGRRNPAISTNGQVVKSCNIFVTEVKGKQEAFIDEDIEYRVTKYSKNIVSNDIKKDIKWAVSVDETVSVLRNKSGEKIILKMKQEWAGKKIKVMAAIHSFRDDVCQHTNVMIVVERYKMPGLNGEGTDIADDMCYGKGDWSGNTIYGKEPVKKAMVDYKLDYEKIGFKEGPHDLFSNHANSNHSKPRYTYLHVPQFIYNMDVIERKIYTDERLFDMFRTSARIFTRENKAMEEVVMDMITKLQLNEGGIYDDPRLTEYIKERPSTIRYCDELREYIDEKLKEGYSTQNSNNEKPSENNNALLVFKDGRRVDWQTNNSPKDAKNRRKKMGKRFSLTPSFAPLSVEELWNATVKIINYQKKNPPIPFSRAALLRSTMKAINKYKLNDERTLFEQWENTFGGATITLNDIWATEVVITEYARNGNEHTVKYRVTLWDHFGLDVRDLKWWMNAPFCDGFYAWFLLQHFRGYRPFITKITFDDTIPKDLKQWH